MKILEDYGMQQIKYFFNIIQKKDLRSYLSVQELFKSMQIYYITTVAFLIGFILTVPCIWIEIEYDIFNTDSLNYTHIFYYSLYLVLTIFIEFYLLFNLGFYTIAYYVYHLQKIDDIDALHLKRDEFLSLFSRTIMELPEHQQTTYSIKHSEITNIDIVAVGLLYKAKVIISNFVLKIVFKKLLARSTFRVYSPYVAAVGTGFWDAYVFYKTIKHSQYKITVRYAIEYILQNRRDIFANEDNIKAVLAKYYRHSEYNNNFEYLLNEISKENSVEYSKESYLDENIYKNCNQRLLILLFCFREKLYTLKERREIKKIGNSEKILKLKAHFKDGDTENIKKYISKI